MYILSVGWLVGWLVGWPVDMYVFCQMNIMIVIIAMIIIVIIVIYILKIKFFKQVHMYFSSSIQGSVYFRSGNSTIVQLLQLGPPTPITTQAQN